MQQQIGDSSNYVRYPPAEVAGYHQHVSECRALRAAQPNDPTIRRLAVAAGFAANDGNPLVTPPTLGDISDTYSQLVAVDEPAEILAVGHRNLSEEQRKNDPNQQRINEIRRENEFDSLLQAIVVTQSSEGLGWVVTGLDDTGRSQRGKKVPLIELVDSLDIHPGTYDDEGNFLWGEYRGEVTGVTHVKELFAPGAGNTGQRYRYLVEYTPGQVLHRLFDAAGPQDFGKRVDFSAHASLGELADGNELIFEVPDDLMLMVPVPNKHSDTIAGASDYAKVRGKYLLLCAVSTVGYEAFMAMAPTLLVDESLMDEDNRIPNGVRTIRMRAGIGEQSEEEGDMLKYLEGKFDSAGQNEYETRIEDDVYRAAGMAPADAGRRLSEATTGATSGVAEKWKSRRTTASTKQKTGNVKTAGERIWKAVIALDRLATDFKPSFPWTVDEVTINLADGVQNDTAERIVNAQGLADLQFSEQVQILEVFPDWTDSQVEEELLRRKAKRDEEQAQFDGQQAQLADLKTAAGEGDQPVEDDIPVTE